LISRRGCLLTEDEPQPVELRRRPRRQQFQRGDAAARYLRIEHEQWIAPADHFESLQVSRQRERRGDADELGRNSRGAVGIVMASASNTRLPPNSTSSNVVPPTVASPRAKLTSVIGVGWSNTSLGVTTWPGTQVMQTPRLEASSHVPSAESLRLTRVNSASGGAPGLRTSHVPSVITDGRTAGTTSQSAPNAFPGCPGTVSPTAPSPLGAMSRFGRRADAEQLVVSGAGDVAQRDFAVVLYRETIARPAGVCRRWATRRSEGRCLAGGRERSRENCTYCRAMRDEHGGVGDPVAGAVGRQPGEFA
jgi:hypothetical protein